MSGILAVVGSVRDSRVEAALSTLRYLGGEREQRWSEEDALLVVTRKEWQLDDDFCGDVLVLQTPDLVVAADASLYDKKGLARKLSTAGVRAHGETASQYLEAAYRAWGPDMVHQLNGDYAFVIWDRRERRLFAARDPMGPRPLYITRIGAGVAIGSSCRALAELRGSAQDLNLVALGGQVAGLAWSNGMDTAYRGVDAFLPARRLTSQDGEVRLETFWRPRKAPERHPAPAAEAAVELREMLATSVSQRMASGTTTVWMSGGWDSSAVFAAGQHALAAGERTRLRPVSISYPKGDPGDENDYIRQIAGHWKADVHWLQSEELQLLDGLEERAARSDEPPAHLYELYIKGLAQGTRATGSRVTLDGSGGDQLFQVSDIILADLLRSGRWIEFARLARSRRGYGWRHIVGLGVLPHVPDSLVRATERILRRRIPRHHLERSPAVWMRPEFSAEHRLRERDLAVLGWLKGSSHAHRESQMYVTMPHWSYGASFIRGSLLQEGVEVRSPLLDMKIVEFGLRRPVSERMDGQTTKTLLRQAMEGLLPPGILASRTHRTGTTVGFSRRRMREAYPALVARIFAERIRLSELGVVDAGALRSAADTYLSGHGDDFLRVNLFQAMKVEFWLRGLERRVARERPPASRTVPVEISAA